MATPDGVKRFSAESVKPKSIGGSEAARFSADSADRDAQPDVRTFSPKPGALGVDYVCKQGDGFSMETGSRNVKPDVEKTAGKGRAAAQDGDKGDLL